MMSHGFFRLSPALLIAALLQAAVPALAADSIRVGRSAELSIFHLPTYIARDRGIFAEEGLDVAFVPFEDEQALTAAGMARKIDFVPDVGGARISIKGAPVRYVVGQSQVAPWVVVADPDSVRSVEQLRGGTLALGPRATEVYAQTVSVLDRAFGMKQDDDYRTVDVADEADRLAALIDGKVQGALISWRQVPKAGIANMDIVLKPGRHLPRLEGAYWVTESYLEHNPDVVRRFIRAIARATIYLKTDQMGSIEVIRERFALSSPAEANVLWNAIRTDFDPAIPADLLRQAFADSLEELRDKGLWPTDRPMPAVEQFIASDVLKTALWEVEHLRLLDF